MRFHKRPAGLVKTGLGISIGGCWSLDCKVQAVMGQQGQLFSFVVGRQLNS